MSAHWMYAHWIDWGPDGDYVVYGTFWTSTADREGKYVEVGRWLIPGTRLED